MITNENTEHLYIAILCGGGGKRLWPRSRVQAPKQFIKLFGEKTIFQKTVERVKKLLILKKLLLLPIKIILMKLKLKPLKFPKENIIVGTISQKYRVGCGYGAINDSKQRPGSCSC